MYFPEVPAKLAFAPIKKKKRGLALLLHLTLAIWTRFRLLRAFATIKHEGWHYNYCTSRSRSGRGFDYYVRLPS